jgi:dTDP-4-amino-4,6-dideoxygalactose transaminase
MKIPFADLPGQYRELKPSIDGAIKKVLDTGAYIQGEPVRQFEADFASAHRSGHCIAVGSGTDALHLALWAMGVGSGDVVVTVPYTFIATVEAILLTGARPVFVDIDPLTYTMDPSALAKALAANPKAKAVLPVHLYGQAAKMDDIVSVSRAAGAMVLEDAAQAHLAKFADTFVGNFGSGATFSFYPAKNLGAFGEAGAVTTNDPELAQTMRRLRDHGQVEKYRHSHWGHNYRMDSIQGAVLGAKLTMLASWTARRRELAAIYDRELKGVGDLRTPFERKGSTHVYHLYVLRTSRRDELQKYLSELDIATALHYPVPLHVQEGLKFLGYRQGDFPVSESAARECLAIPLYPELSDAQIDHLLTTLRAFFAR